MKTSLGAREAGRVGVTTLERPVVALDTRKKVRGDKSVEKFVLGFAADVGRVTVAEGFLIGVPPRGGVGGSMPLL